LKLPRDLKGKDLAKLLKKYDYTITRQSGSHMRLTSSYIKSIHHITIPNHDPIKLGTLNSILNDVLEYLRMNKEDLMKNLFD
jgi:predicted RNA binding protein YcfA (HicA-like mRNA interferase family)